MKRTSTKSSTIFRGNEQNEILSLINNTAFIKSEYGDFGLLNIRSNEIIGNMDYDSIIEAIEDKGIFILVNIKNNTFSIYDAIKEEMIIKDWTIVSNGYDDYKHLIVKAPNSKKLHIFDSSLYGTNKDIFSKTIDNAEFKDDYKYYVIEKNGKKGIYDKNAEESFTPMKYDDIKKTNDITIYTTKGKQFFKSNYIKDKKSSLFDEIIVDSNKDYIIYCKKDNTTYIYLTTHHLERLLLASELDDIKLLYGINTSTWTTQSYPNEFYFQTVVDNKLGLLSVDLKSNVNTILDNEYDEFIVNDNELITVKDNKFGLFVGSSNANKIIEPTYDDIEPINIGYRYYAFKKDGLYDIAKIIVKEEFRPCIKGCEKIETFDYKKLESGTLAYLKDGKYGFLMINVVVNNIGFVYDKKDIVVEPKYDAYTKVKDYFIVEEDDVLGILYKGEELVEPEYEEIDIVSPEKDKAYTYFKLKEDGTYDLERIKNKTSKFEVEVIGNGYYDSVEFLDDMVVFKDYDYTYIFGYDSDFTISVMPRKTDIKQFKYKDGCYYSVNGIYYLYDKGKLIKINDNKIDILTTTFETDTSIYEIKSLIKQEHDYLCDLIESKDEEKAEEMLNDLLQRDNLKDKYPTSLIRRINK